MCWKVVHIEGDGSVKLILEDYNQECNSKDVNGNLNMDGNWSDGKTYAFGYDLSNRADFISFEGGLADSFKTFQTSKLTSTDIGKLKFQLTST